MRPLLPSIGIARRDRARVRIIAGRLAKPQTSRRNAIGVTRGLEYSPAGSAPNALFRLWIESRSRTDARALSAPRRGGARRAPRPQGRVSALFESMGERCRGRRARPWGKGVGRALRAR